MYLKDSGDGFFGFPTKLKNRHHSCEKMMSSIKAIAVVLHVKKQKVNVTLFNISIPFSDAIDDCSEPWKDGILLIPV